jgi:hypothetical protein
VFVTISFYDGVKCGTLECEQMDSWNKCGDECDLRMQMYWFVAIDVLGGVAGIGPSSGQGQSTGGADRWWYFIKSLLNDETMMKCLIEFVMIIKTTMKYRLSSWWMLKQWQKC